MDQLAQEIVTAFEDWRTQWLWSFFEDGGFGYRDLSPSTPGDRNAISSFIGPEADIQMHFGGFLFHHLRRVFKIDRRPQYTVHSEFALFASNHGCVDLAVAKVDSPFKLTQDEMLSSIVAALEIKNQAYFNPYPPKRFAELVLKDIEKLAHQLHPALRERPLAKFVIILDENPDRALRYSEDPHWQECLRIAAENQVRVLGPA